MSYRLTIFMEGNCVPHLIIKRGKETGDISVDGRVRIPPPALCKIKYT